MTAAGAKERGQSTERWITPPEIFDPLHKEFCFDLDAAADSETTRLPAWLDEEFDALNNYWPATVIWCNPPYGRKLEPFVRKCHQQALLGKIVVALIPFRCRAAWWHECVIGRAREVRCVRKRIKFIRANGDRGDFTGSCDSCVVVWDYTSEPMAFQTKLIAA